MLSGVLETRDWSPAAGRAFGDFFKYYVWGGGHASVHWSLGLRKAIRLGALLAVFGAAALSIWKVRRSELRFPIFVFSCVALATILGTGLYLRYLVPFSGLIFVVIFALVPERFLLQRPVQIGFMTILALNLGLFVKRASPSFSECLLVAIGKTPRAEFMNATFGPANDLWIKVNTTVRRDEQVLLAAGRPSYYMDPYCAITEAYYQERLRMDTWANYMSDVRRDNFAYVIVPLEAERSNLIGPPYPAADNEIPFARRLAVEFGTKVGKYGSDELYRLKL
jgi:hypothetical protein